MLHKKIWTVPCYLAIAVGIIGCNNQQAAENTNFQDTTTGYHSTKKDQLVQNLSSPDQTPIMNDLDYKNDSYSKKDVNYHRHLSKPFNAKSSYYTSYEGDLVERINRQVNSVPHVKEVRSLITKEDVIVSVLLEDPHEEKTVKGEINRKIKPLIDNRSLHITTDESGYHRTMRLDNRLRRGDSENLRSLDGGDYFNHHENQRK